MRASPIADLPRPLVVVAHDAGAANLILAWLDPADPPRAVMEGPARALWRARMGDAPLCSDLDEALAGAVTLMSGTGWASDLEHRARQIASERNLRSIAVVDHWVNYAARFARDGREQLPDTIWVVDPEALAIARRQFDLPIIQQPNAYLAAQIAQIGPVSASGSVLVVLEPVRDDWGRGIAGEFQMLDWFMEHRETLAIDPASPIRLRPHPSDPTGKYDAWIAEHPPTVLDDSAALDAAIARADIVVGANSQALVVALAAGRRVICALPPWAPPCQLPFPGIETVDASQPPPALDFQRGRV